MEQGGTIASIGLAASMSLNTTVAPFILRGVSLLGVDSGYIREPYRSGVWQRLATDLRPPHLDAMSRTIPFAALPEIFSEVHRRQGQRTGRRRGRRSLAMAELPGADRRRFPPGPDLPRQVPAGPLRGPGGGRLARRPGSRWSSTIRSRR